MTVKSFVDKLGNRCSRRDDGSLRVSLHFNEPLLTEQSHKDACDINKILERYAKTGSLPVYADLVPKSGDFTNVTDFHTAQCLVADAVSMFNDLSAEIRLSFDHDPGKFLAAVDDPEQRAKLIKLGVILESKPLVQEAPVSIPEGDVKA